MQNRLECLARLWLPRVAAAATLLIEFAIGKDRNVNRRCWLAAFCFAFAALPALARTWNFNNGQKVDGDFVKESYADIGGKRVAVVVLAVGNDPRPYPSRWLSKADRSYVQEQVDLQKKTAAQVDERMWENNKGKTVQARLIGMEKGKVLLLINRCETMRLPFDQFVKEDQDYLRTEMTARGEGDKVPPKKAPPKKPSPKQVAQVTQGTGAKPHANPPKPKSKRPRPKPKSKPKPSATPAKTTGIGPSPVATATPPPHPATAATTSTSAPNSLFAAPAAKSSSDELESSPPAPVVKYRVCSHCGAKLDDRYKLGDNCPNCGAHFTYEDTTDQDRRSEPATFRSYCAPLGFVSLLGVIVATGFRLGWYMLRS